MGKRWWRKALGISNAQRQMSRKLGFPLGGRKSIKIGCAAPVVFVIMALLLVANYW